MQIRQGLDVYWSTGAELQRPHCLTLPAELYGWCTEGFDTADLQEAQAVLEILA